MFQLISVSLLSHVVVTFFSSIVVLRPNGQFSDYATIAFSERYETIAVQPIQTVIYTDTKIVNSKQFHL
jgi:hypothetical protein